MEMGYGERLRLLTTTLDTAWGRRSSPPPKLCLMVTMALLEILTQTGHIKPTTTMYAHM